MTERDRAVLDCLKKCRQTLEASGEYKLVDYIDFVLDMFYAQKGKS
jgi:hypothetical protein